jgi:hypothetical protein
MGHISALVFHELGPVRAITMLSVFSSALRVELAPRWRRVWIGTAWRRGAAVSAGVMIVVWSNATETRGVRGRAVVSPS